jgi:hypothetical protein
LTFPILTSGCEPQYGRKLEIATKHLLLTKKDHVILIGSRAFVLLGYSRRRRREGILLVVLLIARTFGHGKTWTFRFLCVATHVQDIAKLGIEVEQTSTPTRQVMAQM